MCWAHELESQAVSADFAAMVASASRAQCVLSGRKQLASRTGVVAWHTRLAEGAEGISPCALRVSGPPSDFCLGEAGESDKREEGDEPWGPSVSDARESVAGCVAAP
jgi:hypothetical protein